MNYKNSPDRPVSIPLTLAAVSLMLSLLFLPSLFVSQASNPAAVMVQRGLAYYDIRTDSKAADKLADLRSRAGKNSVAIADVRDEIVRGESSLRSRVPTLKVEYNDTLHIPEVIGPDPTQGDASLIGQVNSTRAETLKTFAKDNADLIGISNSQSDQLRTTADYSNPNGELSFVSLEQNVNGIPVFQGEIKAGFTKRGNMFRVINNLAPGLDYSSLSQDFGEPLAAVQTAVRDLKVSRSSLDLTPNAARSNELKQTFGSGEWPTSAEKMYFPTEPGVAVPAWRVLIWQPASAYYEIVDAGTGTILWRKNITNDQTQSATYNVLAATNNLAKALDSPSPGNPTPVFTVTPVPLSIPGYQAEPVNRSIVTLIGNEGALSFNNLGWITDNQNDTQGNAVIAGLDLSAPDGVDSTQSGSSRTFSFVYSPSNVLGGSVPPYTGNEGGDSPTLPDNRSGAVTNLFYLTNRYHDALYQVGFTETAGNYQTNNFGRGGLGNDRISAEAQDYSGTNNANFSTPADGVSGRMQMYLFTNGTAPQRDGSLDANVVLHELTHGVSNRLIGNGAGLGTTQAGGMGEGWSDLVAFLLLSKTNDPPNGIYTTGGYVTYKFAGNNSFLSNYYYGIRRFPYAAKSSTGGPNNRPFNPLTFADIDPAQINCGDGAFNPSPLFGCSPAAEVHNEGELWAVTGVEVWSRMTARLGHDAGTLRTLQLYIDGMKLSPLNPTFLQERDALVAAAQAGGSAGDVADIWDAFAARGMGFSATNPSANTVVQAFDLPNITQTAGLTINDSTGNNNGFPDPGEHITVNIPFNNGTGQAATGVSFQLVGGGGANLATFPNNTTTVAQLQFTVPAVSCGSNLGLTINVNSNIGPTSFARSIVIGSPVTTVTQNFDSVTAPNIPAGWTATSVSGGLNFSTVTTSSDTSPNSAYASDPANGPAGEADLTSPSIAITSSAAVVTFRHRFETEAAWDGGVLEISIGGGAFNDIVAAGGSFISNGYNSTMTAASADPGPPPYTPNPLNGRQGWTGSSGGFITTTAKLPAAAAGQNVQLRWRFGADDNTAGQGVNPGWYLDTISVVGSYSCAAVIAVNHAPFDFDGDGKTDISIYRPGAGEWWIQRSSTAQVTAGAFGNSSDIITPGDFTGDGKADIAFFRPSTGFWFILRSEDNSYFSFPFGLAGDIPAPGDYDHDGKTDAAVFRPSTGTWFILPSGGTGTIITQFGLNGDKPVVADFDGDGKADIAIVRDNAGNKEWWIQRSTAGIAVAIFGVPTDMAVPGDYTGDGKADIAIWRPATGQWFVLRSEDNSYFSVPFGQLGDLPAPGDYDGDGKFDTGVFRVSNSTWFVNRSGGGVPIITGFGAAGDAPVPGAFVR